MQPTFEKELALVNKLTRIITSSLNIEEVYDSFVDELGQHMTVDWASLVLIEQDKLRFRALSSRMSSSWASGDLIPKEGTGTDWVAASKEPLVEADLAQQRRFWTGEHHLKQGIRSIVYLPLLAKGEVFGSLVLGSRRPNAYSERELRLLRHVSGQIAMPIQNAILFEEKESTLRALQRSHSLLQAMLELVRVAGVGLGKKEVFDSFAAGLRKVVPFDEAGINLLDPSGGKYQVYAISSTVDIPVKPGQMIPLKGSGTEWVISRQESFIEPDISQKRRFATDERLAQVGYRTILRVPLCFSGQPFGSFNLRSRQPGVYHETERQIVEQLCALLAHVVWYQHIATLEREESLELKEQDKARTQFVNVLAHEMRTPLTPVFASARLLAEEFHPAPGSPQDRLISSIIRGAEVLEARLSDLLDLAQLQQGAFSLEKTPIDLRVLLHDIVLQFQPLVESRKQSLVLDLRERLPLVKVDGRRIGQVLINLLENAVKFTPDGGSILVSGIVQDRELVIRVQSSGPDLSSEEQRRLFQPYYRGEVDRQRLPGSGLGLYLCGQLIESHGGRIWVESLPGKGITFSFTLPLENSPGQTQECGA